MKISFKKHIFAWLGLLISVAYLLVMHAKNTVPVDAADGILHFGIAQESWSDPVLFLDHWGKPLFTLLASPWAQFGYKSYLLFNILVFILTCTTAFSIFRKTGISATYSFLFPLFLICIPDYTYCVLGGMTETLFGLLIVLMLFCGYTNRWILFAVIASLTLFSRSEGMLVIVLALAVLLWKKQWLALPFLLSGFLVYAVCGYFALDNFLWYFTEDPYNGSEYGHGAWYHYLREWRSYFGVFQIILFPVGMFGWWLFYKRKDGPSAAPVFFALALFAGIVIIHSIFWAYGMKNSAGLTRIATLGLPSFVLIVLMGCDRFSRELHMLPKAAALLLVLPFMYRALTKLPYPNSMNPLEEIIARSAEYVNAYYPDRMIYYHHPFFGLKTGAKLKGDNRIQQYYFNEDINVVRSLKSGSIVIRDPHFGAVEAGLPFPFVEKTKELRLLKKFTANKPYSDQSNEAIEVLLYEIQQDTTGAIPGKE